MGAVFVSYRRGDSEGQARALCSDLVKLLGKESVFMDVDSIALGRDFRQVLQERLNSCDIMVALIGPGWLEAKDAGGNRRLESSTDYVRQEIAAALRRDIPVIPVLVQGAEMPPPDRLPEDMKDLSYRNGFELGHMTWESDIREMVKRLGLGEQKTAATALPASAAPVSQPDVPATHAPPRKQRFVATASLAVAAGVIGLLVYLSSNNQNPTQPVAQVTPLPDRSAANTASSDTSGSSGLPSAASSAAGGPGASGIEFNWPGNDCWDILRGEQYVTHQCGANKQALGPGTYTIKGKYAPVFMPFDVVIKAGPPTRIAKGGVFEFNWPGNDCWDIFRNEQVVTHQCGSNKQALAAGTYTIKGKYAAVFEPFPVDIKDGSTTRIALGGVFTFNWPGNDCWDILRSNKYVTHQCGANKQALQAGTYTVRGKYAPVFNPFSIKVANGSEVKAP